MITNEPTTVNSFYSNNTGLSKLVTPEPSIFNISTWSWSTWLIFFIILALLGFNVFVFVFKGTMTFVDFFMLCVSKIYAFFQGLYNRGLGKNSSSPSSSRPPLNIEGSREYSNETPTAITKEDKQENVGTEDDIMKALNREKVDKLFPSSAQPEFQENKQIKQKGGLSHREQGQEAGRPGQGQMPSDEPQYDADDSYSSIQMSKSSSKSGWCFIGEDRGFRSCIRVGENESCMSGDIFPSQDICINPNLRK
jgi:hypothetical protein